MKTRIINNLTTTINYYNNPTACEATINRLRELGAPQTTINSTISFQAEMRAELPKLLTFIKTLSHHSSFSSIQSAARAAGFTGDTYMAIDLRDPGV
jgi:hypothetical protein